MSTQPEELLVARKFRVVRHVVTGRDGKPNRRVAAGKTLIELPAGTIEAHEDPATTAIRELAEETGYRADKVEKLCEFFMSPGILTERMRLYLALEPRPGQPHLEPGEDIETLVVDWDDAMKMVADGLIEDAKTLVGLLYYDRLRRGA
jgi:ADP-ribose pyrophosphatase